MVRDRLVQSAHCGQCYAWSELGAALYRCAQPGCMPFGVCEPCFVSFGGKPPTPQAADDSEDEELAALQRSLMGAFGYSDAAEECEEVD